MSELKRPASPVEDANKKSKVEERGIAYVKSQYLIDSKPIIEVDDDSAEKNGDRTEDKRGKKKRGQNKNRELKQVFEEIRLCPTLIDPSLGKVCQFGEEKCRFCHDVEKYLQSKPIDLEGVCPVFKVLGYCPSGLKCRFLSSHYQDNKLIKDEELYNEAIKTNYEINKISNDDKFSLVKNKFPFEKANFVSKIYNASIANNRKMNKEMRKKALENKGETYEEEKEEEDNEDSVKENYNEYIETKFYASEKKKLDLVGKKILSPLTTVGNLPYRRLMKTLGADVTYSEMAFTLPLIQGNNAEWALPKAHNSEYPGYGVQIAASKHEHAAKATELISNFCSKVSSIDLNSGCPVDLLCRQGCGAALMDQSPKLIRILNSMNYCSGDIPTTIKIRMGIKDNAPLAKTLIKRLITETSVAGITLHGRSRQQRYTKEANWEYISESGKIIRDTEIELQEDKERKDFQRVNFVGNGDCFNWDDFEKATSDPYIDSVMVGRGALIKPWIFEEIDSRQYLDKSATERLEIIKTFSQFALEHWGADEYGIATSRRFLCEFLSFFYRYTPYEILERVPIKLNQRPQNWKGRNELECLLASGDYKDWIKITEMFLGPAGDSFKFTPKHKSNSYEK